MRGTTAEEYISADKKPQQQGVKNENQNFYHGNRLNSYALRMR